MNIRHKSFFMSIALLLCSYSFTQASDPCCNDSVAVPGNIRDILVAITPWAEHNQQLEELSKYLNEAIVLAPRDLLRATLPNLVDALKSKEPFINPDDYQQAMRMLCTYLQELSMEPDESADESQVTRAKNGSFASLRVQHDLKAGNGHFDGDLSVGGNFGAENAIIHENLGVFGNQTITGNLTVGGIIQTGDIIINDVVVGCNLNLLIDPSTATCGNITKGAAENRFITNMALSLSGDTSNVYAGELAGPASGVGLTAPGRNSGFGADSLKNLGSGTSNTALGASAAAAVSTGSSNSILGQGAAPALTTGGSNIIIGAAANTGGAAAQTNGILLQTGTTTALTLDNQIRIGFGAAPSTSCFIQGINGAGPFANTVFIDPITGQLGSAAGGGGAAWLLGGNAVIATGILGTTTNFGINIITGGAAGVDTTQNRIQITNNGNVTVNAPAAGTSLAVTGSESISCNLILTTNPSTATCGNITKGVAEDRFIHNYGAGADTTNVYVGQDAGSFTGNPAIFTGPGRNSGFGANALKVLVAGTQNTAIGYDALTANVNGFNNTAVGQMLLL